MTTAARTTATKGAEVNSTNINARLTGVLFIITYVTSIPALYLFQPVLDDPAGYIAGAGVDNRILLGAFLELLLIIANIASAVVPFAILSRQNGILALGFVTARVIESVFIAVGLLSLLTVVTLRQEAAGADPGSLVLVGQSLVALHGWTFVLGPGFVVGIGNGLILGYLMYTSRLIPRYLAVLGLIAGPLLIASGTAMLFGVFELGSVLQGIMSIPEFIYELALGIWLTVKGFNPSAVARLQNVSQ